MDLLFVYGTLQEEELLQHISQVTPENLGPAKLMDYACFQVKGQPYPGIKPKLNMQTHGHIFRGFNKEALALLDQYEGPMYMRTPMAAIRENGETMICWCYMVRPQYHHLLSHNRWPEEQEDFLSE